jgi:hypothetical protein
MSAAAKAQSKRPTRRTALYNKLLLDLIERIDHEVEFLKSLASELKEDHDLWT